MAHTLRSVLVRCGAGAVVALDTVGRSDPHGHRAATVV
jgi:hypothetical protein